MTSRRAPKTKTDTKIKTDDTELWDKDATASFFDSLGLQSFHQQRSQLDPGAYLRPYTTLEKLEGYKLLAKDKSVLRPNKTYIRYVHTSDANIDQDYESHVKTGGILVSGGYYRGKKYMASDDYTEWTVLRLKFKLRVLKDKRGRVIDDNPPARVFNIRLNRCHVFYRRFGTDILGDARDLLGYDVELVKG